jgi:hypothetical protein
LKIYTPNRHTPNHYYLPQPPQHSIQHASHQPIPSRSRLPQVYQLNHILIIIIRSPRIHTYIAAQPALGDICIASAICIVNTVIDDGAEEIRSESVNGMIDEASSTITVMSYMTSKNTYCRLRNEDEVGVIERRDDTMSTDKLNRDFPKKF